MAWLDTLRAYRVACNMVAAVLCLALFGYALYAQFYLHLQPCPLCIFQRIAVVALGITFVIAALVPARARAFGIGAAVLIGLVALAGVGVAARHLYIQSLPAGQVPVSGATLEYMWEVFPAFDVLRKVLTGSGECAKVDWTFLGLAMPAWVLIAVATIGLAGVLVNWRSRR
jgi:disulfide bond formation protein DsbB